jgi:hypothetical protein
MICFLLIYMETVLKLYFKAAHIQIHVIFHENLKSVVMCKYMLPVQNECFNLNNKTIHRN